MWLINSAADIFAASFSWFCVAVFASPAWECRSSVGGRLLQHKKKMEERVSALLLADTSSRPVAESARHDRSSCLYWLIHCYVIKSITSSISICFHAFHSHAYSSVAGLTFHQQQQQQSCLVLLTGSIRLLWLIKRRSLCWSKIFIHHPSSVPPPGLTWQTWSWSTVQSCNVKAVSSC